MREVEKFTRKVPDFKIKFVVSLGRKRIKRKIIVEPREKNLPKNIKSLLRLSMKLF